MNPGEQALASAGLDVPTDELEGLLAAYDGVRAMCDSLHALDLGDTPPLTLPT